MGDGHHTVCGCLRYYCCSSIRICHVGSAIRGHYQAIDLTHLGCLPRILLPFQHQHLPCWQCNRMLQRGHLESYTLCVRLWYCGPFSIKPGVVIILFLFLVMVVFSAAKICSSTVLLLTQHRHLSCWQCTRMLQRGHLASHTLCVRLWYCSSYSIKPGVVIILFLFLVMVVFPVGVDLFWGISTTQHRHLSCWQCTRMLQHVQSAPHT